MLDILKQGEVSSIDIEKGKARVQFLDRDDKISGWLNILVPFSESHSDNYHLSVGQTVVVLSIPDMMEQGYILGCPMRTADIGEGEVRRTFSDSGFYSYKNGILTISPIQKVVITSDVEIRKNLKVAGNTLVQGSSVIMGTTTTSGNKVLDTHIHTGVTAGIDKSGGMP